MSTPILVALGLAALVAAYAGSLIWLAERRFAAQWTEGVAGHAPREVWQALTALHVAWPEMMQSVRVRMHPEGYPGREDVTGWTTTERAWSPWGTRVFVAHLDERDPGPVLIHEVVQHIRPLWMGAGANEDHAMPHLGDLQVQLQRQIWGPTGRPVP